MTTDDPTRLAKSRFGDYVALVPVMHIVVGFSAIVAAHACLPQMALAMTSCSESSDILWSQVSEENWPITQSLLDEIESFADLADPQLTPDVLESVIPERPADLTGTAAPEPPGLCFTDLDPSCVRDSGTAPSSTHVHIERGSQTSPQPTHTNASTRARSASFARLAHNPGPTGVRAGLFRPPRV